MSQKHNVWYKSAAAVLALALMIPVLGACDDDETKAVGEEVSIIEGTTPIMGASDIASLSFCDVTYGYDIEITSTTLIPVAGDLPEHLDVRGIIWPEIQFVVELPSQWNERYYQIGNGGLGGHLLEDRMVPGLMKGFAAAANNTGHDVQKEPGGLFGYPSDTNPDWAVKIDDYAYRADHETAVLAKNLINAYYGKAPTYSYFVGTSNGGREGLKEAQMYPKDFDGLVIGMPVLHITAETMRGIWNSLWGTAGEGAIPTSKLPVLAEAVRTKCDGIDGLEDGLINDPRKCTFDPYTDLPPGSFTD